MKWFVLYWVVGCVVIGKALAVLVEGCPNDKIPDLDRILKSTVIWPVFISATHFGKRLPHVCDDGSVMR